MNIFVIFEKYEAEENFLCMEDIQKYQTQGKLTTSSREPVVIFQNLSSSEVSQIRNLAHRWNGRVLASRKYAAY